MNITQVIAKLKENSLEEGQQIEFKSSFNKMNEDQFKNTIRAFANDYYNKGIGFIIVGVDNQTGKVIGTEYSFDDFQQKILFISKQKIFPAYEEIDCGTEPYYVNGKRIFIISCRRGSANSYVSSITSQNETKVNYF
jgi:predicted HTH transcriptional regulator